MNEEIAALALDASAISAVPETDTIHWFPWYLSSFVGRDEIGMSAIPVASSCPPSPSFQGHSTNEDNAEERYVGGKTDQKG